VLIVDDFLDFFQSTQQGEGQDDAAVLGLPEVAAQEVGDGPDFVGGGGEVRRYGGGWPAC
jgi:hypothetical protein